MRKGVTSFVLVVLTGGCVCLAKDKIIDATVCEILEDPAEYNGKMVRVRGRVVTFFEVFALRDVSCREGHKGIWLTYPGKDVRPHTTFPLLQDEQFRRFKQYIESQPVVPQPPGTSDNSPPLDVTATVVGRLDGVTSAKTLTEIRAGYVGTGVKGFGHLNQYAARLVIRSVSDVQATQRK